MTIIPAPYFKTKQGLTWQVKFQNASTPLEYFVNKSDFVMETKPLSKNELKDVFYSPKSNQSPVYNDISYIM